MVVDRAKIERLEKDLQEARKELWKEDAKRYKILVREMSEADRQRIMESLTDREERVLFGLEAPEESRKRVSMRLGGAGGDLMCPLCGRAGLTEIGLKLHTARMPKSEKSEEEVETV